jgi:hypothetical protein
VTPAQKAVVNAAMGFVGQVPEDAGDNDTSTNRWFQNLFGWGVGQPWCAMQVCRIGATAGVLAQQDMSAGAWALNEHLAALPGGRLSGPEVGCSIAYNWGTGHIGVVVRLDPDPAFVWTVEGNTGNGNPAEGDGCYLNRRFIPGQLHEAAPFARFPGVAHPHPQVPGNPNPWNPHRLVQITHHADVWLMRLRGGHELVKAHVPDHPTYDALIRRGLTRQLLLDVPHNHDQVAAIPTVPWTGT